MKSQWKVPASTKNCWVKLRRRELLSSSALGGGALALALVVTSQNALAQCTVTVSSDGFPNKTVACNSTTTTDTTNFDGKVSPSTDRTQLFQQFSGTVTARVNSGATVDGFGLAIVNATTGDINFLNQGTIKLTSGYPKTFNSVLALVNANLEMPFGNVTYSGNGNINPGAFLNADGLSITNPFGSVKVEQTGGAIFGANGISISTNDSSGVFVTTAGLVQATTSTGSALNVSGSSANITIANSGVLSSFANTPNLSAIAISGTYDSASLTNTGSIIGTVAMTGTSEGPLTNSFTNNGTWITSGLNSFSGTSTITNGGTLVATGATTLSGGAALGFTNAGIINIQSANASNQLTLSGNYVGTPGSQVLVSVDPLRGKADQLNVQGTSSGNTTIFANYLSQGLVTTGIPIVRSGPGSTATFTLANPLSGLFQYSLNQSSPGAFSLTSALNGVGIAAASMNQTAAHVSQVTIAGIEDHLELLRDRVQRRRPTSQGEGQLSYADEAVSNPQAQRSPATDALAMAAKSPGAAPAIQDLGPKAGVWIQAFGDWQRQGGSAVAASVVGQDRTVNTYGFQAGFDETWRNLISSADALVVGIVGGQTVAHQTYSASDMRVRLDGPGLGIYSTYINGGFSADAIIKNDWYSLSENQPSIGVSNSVDLRNFNVAGNLQYKFPLAHNDFIEPTAGFTYTNTQYSSGAATLGLEPGHLVRLQAGVRFGAGWDWNNIQFGSTLLFLAYDNVQQTGTALTNIGVASPSDVGLIRGEVDAEINANFGNGFSGLMRGEVRFGDNLIGGAIKIGARKQW